MPYCSSNKDFSEPHYKQRGMRRFPEYKTNIKKDINKDFYYIKHLIYNIDNGVNVLWSWSSKKKKQTS